MAAPSVREEFLAALPVVQRLVSAHLASYGPPGGIVEYLEEMVEYNLAGGKMHRGVAVLETAHVLRRECCPLLRDRLAGESLEQFAILGWCIELLQSSFLIADDIMDESACRRGVPCWYKRVGMQSINDSFILQSALFRILKERFGGDKGRHASLLDLFLSVKYATEVGQLADLMPTARASPEGAGGDVTAKFTRETYAFIGKHKTAYYSFYLPIAAALILADVADEGTLGTIKAILIDLGIFYQIQDDYLDCYGDPAARGKAGTDIAEGKCTWLIVEALQSPSITAEQRAQLVASYGRKGERPADAVRAVYDELAMGARYASVEAASEAAIRQSIAAVPSDAIRRILLSSVGAVFRPTLK